MSEQLTVDGGLQDRIAAAIDQHPDARAVRRVMPLVHAELNAVRAEVLAEAAAFLSEFDWRGDDLSPYTAEYLNGYGDGFIISGDLLRGLIRTGDPAELMAEMNRNRAAIREKASATPAPTATPQPEAEAEPVPLRWGLDDVMYGDDDTTTLLLSGPNSEPYWLELGPERTAALQDCLTGPGEPEPEPLTPRQEHVLALIRSSRGDGIWGTGDLVPLYRAWHTRNDRHAARKDLYDLSVAGHLTRFGPDQAIRYRLNTRTGGA